MPSQTSLKLYPKPCSHSNHLIVVFVGFRPWFRLFQKNQRHFILVPKVIWIISTAVLGTNPTGPGLTLCKIHQFKLKRPLAHRVSCLVGTIAIKWHLALKCHFIQF